VVATQGTDDEAVMERAVAARPAYLGLVSSRRRGAAVLGYLADRGLAPDQLDKVRVPAGLDLGRTTHTEIAVAILAELVKLRASGALPAGVASARERGQRRPSVRAGHPSRPFDGASQVEDPVCGMTVSVQPATASADRGGVTYYFCSDGCRHAFEKDPAAYAGSEGSSPRITPRRDS
jgi:xanthine dehydrogenase accessory factor